MNFHSSNSFRIHLILFLLLPTLFTFSSSIQVSALDKWTCDHNYWYNSTQCEGEPSLISKKDGYSFYAELPPSECQDTTNYPTEYSSILIYNCTNVSGTCGTSCQSNWDCQSNFTCQDHVQGKICWNEDICGSGPNPTTKPTATPPPSPTFTPSPTSTPAPIPTANITSVCSPNQSPSSLSYNISLTNINPTSVFNKLDFQICLYPQKDSNHKYVFENLFNGNATWKAGDGSWQCYRLGDQITQLSGNSLNYRFDSTKKIGGTSASWSKTIDQMVSFVDQAVLAGNMSANPTFPLKAVLTVNNKTNDQLFAGNKKIQSGACNTPTTAKPTPTNTPIPTVKPTIFGDTNQDNRVDFRDILNHINTFGIDIIQGIYAYKTDLNNDKVVNIFDYVYSLQDFGLSRVTIPTIEPSYYVRARGTALNGIYPTFQLLNRFDTVILEQTVTDNWENYAFTLTLRDRIMTGYKIKFINDSSDRNLYIDYLHLHGQKLESEADTTYSTGTWNSTTQSCSPGYPKSESLHCNGYFEYNKPSDSNPN